MIIRSREKLFEGQPQNFLAKGVGREIDAPRAGLYVVRRLCTAAAVSSRGRSQRFVLAADAEAWILRTGSIHNFTLARVGIVPRWRRQHVDDLGGPNSEPIVCKPRAIVKPQLPAASVKRCRRAVTLCSVANDAIIHVLRLCVWVMWPSTHKCDVALNGAIGQGRITVNRKAATLTAKRRSRATVSTVKAKAGKGSHRDHTR